MANFKSFKIFGVTIQLGAAPPKNAPNEVDKKRKVSQTVRKIVKREVSFQIADIKFAILLAQNPFNQDRLRLHEIYRYILRDGHLKSQIRIAKMKVLSEPWMMYRNDQPDTEATKLFTKRWFNNIIENILEAELHGYSPVELDGLNPTTGEIKTVDPIDREFISVEQELILLDGTIAGASIPYPDIAWDIDLLIFGGRKDFGTLLECSYNIIWKYYARSDWSRASEKFGMPILSITAGTNNDDELDELENRAANFGNDGYIVAQQGDTVNIIERTGQKLHDIYFDNIKYCDEQVSKIVNGQTATSDQKSFVGSAEVQERVMEDMTTARLQAVVNEVNEKVIPYLAYKGFKVDGLTMNYPALIRNRQDRINGKPLSSDPTPAPNEPPDPKEKENTDAPPVPDPKNE